MSKQARNGLDHVATVEVRHALGDGEVKLFDSQDRTVGSAFADPHRREVKADPLGLLVPTLPKVGASHSLLLRLAGGQVGIWRERAEAPGPAASTISAQRVENVRRWAS